MADNGHIYQGDCPDELQPMARDPNCSACCTMTHATERHSTCGAAVMAAVAAEREACAVVCETEGARNDGITCAELIRERGCVAAVNDGGERR